MDLKKIRTDDAFLSDIFENLGGEQASLSGDAFNSHSLSTIDDIHEKMFDEVKSRHIKAGITFQTVAEAQSSCLLMAGDGFFNEKTGVGTLTDPQMLTKSNVPVMFGPMEASSMYASGGLPAVIVDKKAKGMVGAGISFRTFEPDFWTTDKIKKMEEAAELTGLNDSLTDTIRDALLQGGSSLHPIFRGDNPRSLELPLDRLKLEKGCITRWVCADRWNIVYVPSFIITAEDYLRPKTIYLPLGGYAVHTSRCLLLRPKSMPYWAMLYNIGWSPSDYSGYMRSLLNYIIIHMSLPIMAQQMSLLLYEMPLDALQAAIGPENIKKIMDINSENMSNWSMLNPQAINAVGGVKVIDRTFSGFDQFLEAAKSDLAANCGISQPLLFYTQNKGFSDNTQQALLKESEMMKMLQRQIETQLISTTGVMIAHVFGTESEEWNQRSTLLATFDRPMVSTEKDQAEIAARFAATIASLSQADFPLSTATELAKQFFKSIEVTDEMMNEIKEAYEWRKKMEEQGAKRKAEGGMGHSMASPGNAANAGQFAKAK